MLGAAVELGLEAPQAIEECDAAPSIQARHALLHNSLRRSDRLVTMYPLPITT